MAKKHKPIPEVMPDVIHVYICDNDEEHGPLYAASTTLEGIDDGTPVATYGKVIEGTISCNPTMVPLNEEA